MHSEPVSDDNDKGGSGGADDVGLPVFVASRAWHQHFAFSHTISIATNGAVLLPSNFIIIVYVHVYACLISHLIVVVYQLIIHWKMYLKRNE